MVSFDRIVADDVTEEYLENESGGSSPCDYVSCNFGGVCIGEGLNDFRCTCEAACRAGFLC